MNEHLETNPKSAQTNTEQSVRSEAKVKPAGFISEPDVGNLELVEVEPSEITETPVRERATAVVITERANLREFAGLESPISHVLLEGSEVRVLSQRGGWFNVSYFDRSGWLHGNTIKYRNEGGNAPPIYSAGLPKKVEITDSEYETSAPPTRRDLVEQIVTVPNPSIPNYSAPRSEPEIRSSIASAICADGTLSYSQNRRGTCSHHGGVSQWLNSPTIVPSSPSRSNSSPGSDYRPKTMNVRGYYRRDGTYVRPHTRRSPRRRN